MTVIPPIQPTEERLASEHALAARERKKIEAVANGVDEQFISALVELFYTKVRDDDVLGPIFAERVDDWPHHLDRMKAFWRSILHNSGEFSGNPMLKHVVIPDLTKRHFARWLELFYPALRELSEGRSAIELVAARARSIAESLLTGISIRRGGVADARAGKDLPYV